MKPPKENEKQQKKVSFNKKGNCACDNGENNSDQKIYVSMTCMSVNDEFLIGDFGDSLQLTNWIFYPGATCHT